MSHSTIDDRAPSVEIKLSTKSQLKVGVIGTGWFGSSFCARLRRNGIETRLGSRNPEPTGFLQDFQDVLVSVDDAIAFGDIIILAIPQTAHESFIKAHGKRISDSDKVIVDVSNTDRKRKSSEMSSAERLIQLLDIYAKGQTPVVKAFNNISAYELDNEGHIQRLMVCGNNQRAVEQVMALARDMKFQQVLNMGDVYESASYMESLPHAYFEKWRSSLWLALAIFTFFIFWATFRYNVYSNAKYPWKHWIIQITDKATSSVSLVMLALTYLPGCIAQTFNVVGVLTTGARARIPKWLVNWLNARKQIGLVALYFGIVHTFQALLVLNASYYSKYYEKPSDKYPVPKYNTEGEIVMFFGLVGLLFMAKQSVSSLPSVQALMSWKEFSFVQVYFGWIALIASALHVIVIAWPSWTNPSKWPGGLPGITLMSTLIPMITIGWKILLLPLSFVASKKKVL